MGESPVISATGSSSEVHQSVLLSEVLEYLNPVDGGVYVDGNLGMGGHSQEILKRCSPTGRVIGFDWDGDALAMAKERLAGFGNRMQYVQDNFAALPGCLAKLGVGKINGLLLDLGLSSYQLDGSSRGFSFRGSQPLDMRMDERRELTAAHLINTATEDELADIFYYYGEERQARRIAAFVVESRKKQPIAMTDELVSVVERAVPKRYWPKKIHVATKVFQGLRIVVNGELENLTAILQDGVSWLDAGAVFCVISFHSLEDRIVKKAFRDNRNLELVTKRPIIPGDEECQANPRSRSAKLRVARKRGQS